MTFPSCKNGRGRREMGRRTRSERKDSDRRDEGRRVYKRQECKKKRCMRDGGQKGQKAEERGKDRGLHG
jgi:hypothetical protein